MNPSGTENNSPKNSSPKNNSNDDQDWHLWSEKTLKPVLQSGQLSLGISLLEEFLQKISKHPNLGDVLVTLANLYSLSREKNHEVHALHYYRKAQEIFPEQSFPYQKEAELHLKMNNPALALDRLKEAFFINPHEEESWELYRRAASQVVLPVKEKADIILYTGHPDFGLMPLPHQLGQVALGGAESVFLLMAKALKACGLKVRLYSGFEKVAVDEGIVCVPLKDFFVDQKIESFSACIVSRFYEPFLRGFKAQKKVFWLHERATAQCLDVYQKMDPQIDEYWFLSKFQKKTYQENCQTSEEKSWLTTNPVDLSLLETLFKKRLKLNQRQKGRIIYTSRPDRGLDIFLKVYENLKKKFSWVTAQVFTYTTYPHLDQDPLFQPYLAQLKSLQVPYSCLGKKELLEEVSKSHLVIYPNADGQEVCSVASIEAQAAGTPILTSDSGSMGELVQDQKTGMVFHWDGNREHLVTQLTEAAEKLFEESVWEEFSKRAFDEARQKHDPYKIAKEWIFRLRI